MGVDSPMNNASLSRALNFVFHKAGLHVGRKRNLKTIALPYDRGNMQRSLFFQDLLYQVQNVEGSIVECGVGWGRSIAHLALHTFTDPRLPDRNIFGFDSFEGFPEPSEEDNHTKTGVKRGRYRTSERSVVEFLLESGISDRILNERINLVKGFFHDTLYQTKLFCFMNLDGDLYNSYKVCLEALLTKVNRGGIIIFDEFESEKYPGCRKAILEYFEESEILRHNVWPRHYVVTSK